MLSPMTIGLCCEHAPAKQLLDHILYLNLGQSSVLCGLVRLHLYDVVRHLIYIYVRKLPADDTTVQIMKEVGLCRDGDIELARENIYCQLLYIQDDHL